MQLWDQGNNTKVDIPTHVLYSIYNLGHEFNVPAVWANYTHASAGLTTKGIGEGKGHFIIEEAPGELVAELVVMGVWLTRGLEEAVEQLNTFLDRLGVGK